MLGQKKLLQRLVPGVMHALIFWGFLVLFPTIVMAMIGAVNRDCGAAVARRARAGSWRSSTCSCVLVLAGVAMAVVDPQGRAAARASTARTSARRT